MFKVDEKISFKSVGNNKVVNDMKLQCLNERDKISIRLGDHIVGVIFLKKDENHAYFNKMTVNLNNFEIVSN